MQQSHGVGCNLDSGARRPPVRTGQLGGVQAVAPELLRLRPGTERDVVPSGAELTSVRRCGVPSRASASGMPATWRGPWKASELAISSRRPTAPGRFPNSWFTPQVRFVVGQLIHQQCHRTWQAGQDGGHGQQCIQIHGISAVVGLAWIMYHALPTEKGFARCSFAKAEAMADCCTGSGARRGECWWPRPPLQNRLPCEAPGRHPGGLAHRPASWTGRCVCAPRPPP